MKCSICTLEIAEFKCKDCGSRYCKKCSDMLEGTCDCRAFNIISLNDELENV